MQDPNYSQQETELQRESDMERFAEEALSPDADLDMEPGDTADQYEGREDFGWAGDESFCGE